MRRFSQSTKADYEELDMILSDGQLHVFNNRELPPGCNPRKTRIGFEKDGDIYTLYVDTGVETSVNNEDFVFLLKNGELKFVGMDDLMSFFTSIKTLFKYIDTSDEKGSSEKSSESEHGVITTTNTLEEKICTGHAVVDRQKLEEINNERNQIKEVWPEDISSALKNQIYGQDRAIDALAEGIATNYMRNSEKVYVALLLGPPATGKTETGKLLPEILSKLYGRDYGFIKIDCNTYKREHTIHSILGAPPSYVGSGKPTLLDPIRKNPYHIVLFDEIEKAHEDLLVALMEALDTGFLSMADNSPKIDMNKCIVLFTSNIPIDMDVYNCASEYEKNEMCKDVFTKHCGRPEVSRRIRDFMVFDSVSDYAKVDIIIKFSKRTLADYGAELFHIDENLMSDFLKFRTKYGASEIGNYVERAISRAIIKSRNRNIVVGKKIYMKGVPEDIVLEMV